MSTQKRLGLVLLFFTLTAFLGAQECFIECKCCEELQQEQKFIPDSYFPKSDSFIPEWSKPDSFIPEWSKPDSFIPEWSKPDSFIPEWPYIPECPTPNPYIPEYPGDLDPYLPDWPSNPKPYFPPYWPCF